MKANEVALGFVARRIISVVAGDNIGIKYFVFLF